MNSERWRQIEDVLQAALELEPGERADFLERACAGDPGLREEVESLLLSAGPARDFLGANALEDASTLILDEESESVLGRTLGHYFVEARLGAGGMGEVYLARDLALGRKVALKLLDPVISGDASSRARFLREARLAASLDHPNICTIHDVGESEGRPFIAMQYVEGETLKAVIGGRPLKLNGLLSVALQVAEALAAAHARGIVHRDIKTSNIIVMPQGQAKVLDFGIAKLVERGAAGIEVTVTGQIVGTPSAMSPEQARGLEVDARTDVWSLGVVLYEMLTGRAPFAGETASDVIALILRGEPPPPSQYAAEAPAAIQRVIDKALKKDPDERYQTVGEMLEDLRELRYESEFRAAAGGTMGAGVAAATGGINSGTTSSAQYLVGAVKRHRALRALAAAALLIALTLVGVVLYRAARREGARSAGETPAPFQTMKMTRLTTAGTATAASASPDGRYVAYATGEAVRTGYITRWPAGRSSLWVKQVSTDRSVEIIPAADVQYKGTTFSRDGEFVYYTAVAQDTPAGALYRVSVLGGTPRKILAGVNSPVSFSPDGKQFAFVRNRPSEGINALMVADAGGGNERTLAVRGGSDWFEEDGPAWSPDGRAIACGVGTDTGGTHLTLAVVPVEGGEPKAITPHRWTSIGRVAWLGDGGGMVVIAAGNLDASTLGTDTQVWHVAYPEGEARKITNDLNNYHHASLGFTSDGRSLVVAQEDTSARIWVANFDSSFAPGADAFRPVTAGKFEGRHGLSWTPDGRIVYVTRTGEDEDVWVMGGDGGDQRQLTDDAAFDDAPTVSPDGRSVYFSSVRTGTRQVWRMDLDGGHPRQLTDGPSINYVPGISPDGRWVAFTSWRTGAAALWKMPAEGGEPVRLTQGPAGRPLFSPDGKSISCVYYDAEGGRFRLAIIPAEGGPPARLLDLSAQHVNVPAGLWWTPDGRSLIYVETRGGVSNVWRLPLGGGPPKQLTDFDSGQIFDLALSRDGRRLALVRGTVTSDVVLISDPR